MKTNRCFHQSDDLFWFARYRSTEDSPPIDQNLERDLKSELMNVPARNFLKNNAIPTLKLPRNRETASTTTTTHRTVNKLENARFLQSVIREDKPSTSASANTRDTDIHLLDSPLLSSPLSSDGPPAAVEDDSDFEICQMSEASESSADSGYQPLHDYVDQYFLVYGKKLDQLMKFCSECGNTISPETIKKEVFGSMVRVRYGCLAGHSVTWCSQPQIGKLPLGDLSMTTSLCLTGNTYSSMRDVADNLNFQIHSRTTHQNLTK